MFRLRQLAKSLASTAKGINKFTSNNNNNNNNNNRLNSTTAPTDWSSNIRLSRPGVDGYSLPPLTESVRPQLKSSSPAVASPSTSSIRSYKTSVTKLDNGMRVASEKLFGDFCTVGVIVDSGPRYEKAPFVNGTTHFLEKLAFNSTTNFETREKIMETLEKHGAICDCQAGRDAIVYALSCRRSGLPEILDLLADTLYRPLFQDFEIEQVRQSIAFELEDLHTRTDPEPLLAEMLHQAAFNGSPLAHPKLCPPENIETINSTDLYSFVRNIHVPSRTVLACVGTDHDEFVELANEKFNNKKVKPIWEEEKSNNKKGKQSVVMGMNESGEIDVDKSVWKGGSCIIEKDLSDLNQGSNNQLPELTHLVVGLETPAFLDERDFVASCVINTLMGGGGSFSAGGPGKGMYSRLYLDVLNRYHFMFSATAYNQSYVDSGVFYIHASSPPQFVGDMCQVVGRELLKMAGPCNPEELSRAKTQLQSMLFMNLEQRPVLFEDVARQVLSRGKREQAKYYFDRIESIQEEDVRRVAQRMLESPPAVAVLGRLDQKVDPYEMIKKILATSSSSKNSSKTTRVNTSGSTKFF